MKRNLAITVILFLYVQYFLVYNNFSNCKHDRAYNVGKMYLLKCINLNSNPLAIILYRTVFDETSSYWMTHWK